MHADDLKAVYGLVSNSKLVALTSLIAGFKNRGLAIQVLNKRWRATTKLKNHYDGFPSRKQGMSHFNYAAVRERAYRIKELGFDAPLEQLLGD